MLRKVTVYRSYVAYFHQFIALAVPDSDGRVHLVTLNQIAFNVEGPS